MKIADISVETKERIKAYRWDRIIEKHEGPEHWDSVFAYDDPEFMIIDGHTVLLPVEKEHHAHITILRCIPSQDGQTLTIFLKDTTHVDDSELETFQAGFVAICEKVKGEEFFITTLYHEWFIISNG